MICTPVSLPLKSSWGHISSAWKVWSPCFPLRITDMMVNNVRKTGALWVELYRESGSARTSLPCRAQSCVTLFGEIDMGFMKQLLTANIALSMQRRVRDLWHRWWVVVDRFVEEMVGCNLSVIAYSSMLTVGIVRLTLRSGADIYLYPRVVRGHNIELGPIHACCLLFPGD